MLLARPAHDDRERTRAPTIPRSDDRERTAAPSILLYPLLPIVRFGRPDGHEDRQRSCELAILLSERRDERPLLSLAIDDDRQRARELAIIVEERRDERPVVPTDADDDR